MSAPSIAHPRAPGFGIVSGVGAPPELRDGRAHEAQGPLARAFAAMEIGRRAGPAIWIRGPRSRERLDPYGLAAFCDPGRLVFVDAPKPLDAFWAMEEALRSGAASVVVGEAPEGVALTPGRRLQLAAETGGGLGIVVVGLDGAPPPAGASAAETRWRVAPDGARRWRLTLTKNKRGAPGAWTLARRDGAARDGRSGDDGWTARAENRIAVAAQGGG